MLNFPLELESPLFMNARVMRKTMALCADARMPWRECLNTLKETFPDLTEDQFMEVRYENHEEFCVRRGKLRGSQYRGSLPHMKRMLEARNHPDFNIVKPIQQMGRGLRMEGGGLARIIKRLRDED